MSAKDYISLIYKDLANEISADEKRVLDAWLEADVDNRVLVDQLRLIWDNAELTDFEHEMEDVDLDVEFNFLKERLKADEYETIVSEKDSPTPHETPVVKMPRRFWTMAAGFALLIGLSWFFISQFNSQGDFAEIKTDEEGREVLLADGTQIYMNANSVIKYPRTFDGEIREIEFSGEAFFDVAKDPQHPFIIHTPFEDITVLGTSFNVRAYEDETNSEIAVRTGSVKVNSGLISAILEPNEKAIVDHSSKEMAVEKTESLNELAWHTKSLRFSNTPLSVVIADLEDFYDVTIKVSNAGILNCPYTDSFGEEDNVNTAIQSIATVFGITVKQEDNSNYTLVGGSCE